MDSLTPIRYRLELAPNLETFKFKGRVEISMQAERPTAQIELNALALAIWRCQVRIDEKFVDCRFEMDPQTETVRIALPRDMSDGIEVRIDYEGIINDKLGGWYRSGYVVDNHTRYMAVTQFQESHARQALPCFDSPENKATFEVSLLVDRQFTVISNQTVVAETRAPEGKKRVRFRRTPKMSSYLLFLGVGEFDFLSHDTDERVRTFATPGRIQETEFGLEFGSKSLRFCEDYFKIPYPLRKMDLIAVPDFAFGAMENWGAITFRENLLLYDPETTSQAGVARICEVIAHEIVHQWFGNLVSPSDWKYLWLNESFATYFGYGVVDHYYPAWKTWEQFVYGQSASALVRDGLFETFPIEIPGGEHVVINSATAPIIYNKGGSILRQIKGYIGDDGFREGLFKYLEGHAYGCATSSDLWNAFEAAAQKPVSALMKSWIEQPGFPLITAERKGRELVLTQRRFTYLDQPLDPATPSPSATAADWLIPVSVLVLADDGSRRTEQILMDQTEARLDLGSDEAVFKLNASQTGFFRVHYAHKAALAALGPHIRTQALDPFDRWGLQDDLFAMVRRGDAGMGDYLDFLRFFNDEDAFLPLMSIADHLHLSLLVLTEASAVKVKAVGREFLGNILSRIGFAPVIGESHGTAILRDHLLSLAAACGAVAATDFALDQFTALVAGKSVHPDIMKSVAQVGAMVASEKAFDWLVQRIETSASEHERMNLLTALGCVRTEAYIKQGLAFAMEKVPSRNKHIPLASFAENPGAVDYMWPWYLENKGKFAEFHPLIFERVISSIIPISGMSRPAEVMNYFKDDYGKSGASPEVVKMSLEKLAINVRMRGKESV